MKTQLNKLKIAIVATICTLALASCVSTTTTVTSPDGTVTVIEQRGIDAPTVGAATAIAEISAASLNANCKITSTK